MFQVSYNELYLLAAIALAAYFGVRWLIQKDTEVEARRQNAIALSQALAAQGFVRMPKLLSAYAVGDYSGIGHELKELHDLAKGGPKAVLVELDGVFEKVLASKLSDPETANALKKRVNA